MAEKEKTLGLHNLAAPRGATKTAKRKGRGPGSGLGKTAGRGHKGQRARKSGNVRPGFEGGQMPIIRRLPKRGFTNPFRVESQPVNLRDLTKLPGTDVTPAALAAAGLVSGGHRPVKVLGTGEATRAYAVSGCLISATAKEKIEQAGGKVEA
ncbi:MAG: 50S ribosomal protein L15 [Gemmatimonadota bacterium]|nr:50S ribosomal protein L15 [Gemmatimonadota bacterium]MDH5195808.1 50S ribosomal protein L15 [Gemmatimonadota bacterium]